jgi:hypothetical protein
MLITLEVEVDTLRAVHERLTRALQAEPPGAPDRQEVEVFVEGLERTFARLEASQG